MFIQRFLLFLGEPVYTFAVVLAGLLGFSGIGSWVVGRLDANNRSSLIWIIPSILAVLLLDAILSPWIFNSALGLPLAWRIIVVVMLAPLGNPSRHAISHRFAYRRRRSAGIHRMGMGRERLSLPLLAPSRPRS